MVSEDVSYSTTGAVYNNVGHITVVASDGNVFTSLGDFISFDPSIRLGDLATGRGAIYNESDKDWGVQYV